MKKITNLIPSKFGKSLRLFSVLFLFVTNSYAQLTQVLIPATGSNSIPCGQNSIVKAHNANIGTYNNNVDGFVVIDAGFAAAITINATYTTEASFDFIRIYNGVGTGGALLATYSGQNLTFTFTGTPGQTVTVRFNSDGSVVYAGFDLTVTYNGPCFAAPCTSVPITNTILGTPVSICPAANSSLSLAYTYSLGGISYQWLSSTVSAVGPFTPVSPNATLSTLITPTLGTTTWFAAMVTCTNTSQSSTSSGQQILVQGQTTNNVPYYESFEGVAVTNQLPNCSWAASNIPNSTQTYTTSASNNRVPRTGSKFAAFANTPTGTKYFYSNGIQLQPGITYSAGIWFATEYFGHANWTNLSLLVGAAQTPTGLQQIVQTGPAVSGPYKALGGLFTVPSAGLYYIAVRATAASGSAVYLSWDDLEVTVPCTANSGNTPTMNIGVSSNSICAGDQIVFSANGADLYSWNGTPGSSTFAVSPGASTTYTIVGTNSLTGCSETQHVLIHVDPTPTVYVVTNKSEICLGETAYLSAYGAISYIWSNSTSGNVISVSPSANTTYTVVGSNAFGCAGTETISVAVKPNPTVTIVSSNPTGICENALFTLNAFGGQTYQWLSSSSPVLQFGSSINQVIQTTTTYTLIGAGANGCQGFSSFIQIADVCGGIFESANKSNLKVYPNPSNSILNFETVSDLILSIRVTDVSGRLMSLSEVNSNTAVKDISELAPGIYYMDVNFENHTQVVKIVKN